MSYHGHRNVEQIAKMEGQAQPLEGHLHKGSSYATPSEASFNEVYSELQHGSARMFKKALSSGSEPNMGVEIQGGGGFKNGGFAEHHQLGIPSGTEGQLKQLGAKAKLAELKELGPGGGGSKFDLKQGEIIDGNVGGMLPNDIEFSKKLDEATVAKKLHGLKDSIGYGESFGKKISEKNDSNYWGDVANNIKLGMGIALGPAGIPLVMDALRNEMSVSKSAYGEAHSGIQREMIQRGKMLKSWRPSEE